MKMLQVFGKSILISSLLINSALGQAFLDKGAPTPYKGVLFTEEQERQLRSEVNELTYTKKEIIILRNISETQDKNINIYEQRLSNYREQLEKTTTELVNRDRSGGWEKAAYFFGGALITGLIGYGVYTSAVR